MAVHPSQGHTKIILRLKKAYDSKKRPLGICYGQKNTPK